MDVDAPPSLAAVRRACDAGQAVEIDYHSASRDESTTRVVEPVQVITMDGHWYLDAFCQPGRRHAALPGRSHRRPAAARHAGSGDPHRAVRAARTPFSPGPGAVEVQLHLGEGAQWVPESVPVRGVAHSRTER